MKLNAKFSRFFTKRNSIFFKLNFAFAKRVVFDRYVPLILHWRFTKWILRILHIFVDITQLGMGEKYGRIANHRNRKKNIYFAYFTYFRIYRMIVCKKNHICLFLKFRFFFCLWKTKNTIQSFRKFLTLFNNFFVTQINIC